MHLNVCSQTLTQQKQTTRKSYDLTATEYACRVADLMQEPEIKKFTTFLPKEGAILDLGCGPGRDAHIFKKQGFDVTGIDFSYSMIEIAQKRSPRPIFL